MVEGIWAFCGFLDGLRGWARGLRGGTPTEPWLSCYSSKELVQGQVSFLLGLLSVSPSLSSGLDGLKFGLLDGQLLGFLGRLAWVSLVQQFFIFLGRPV